MARPDSPDRIALVPLRPTDLLALLESADTFAEASGWLAAEGLREFFVSDEVSPDWLAALREARSADPWVHGFGVRLLDAGEIIGTVGFKGAPDTEGVVEIGYGIVPQQQGRGLASEAAAAGVRFAFDDARVGLVRAHTLPEGNASTRVLEKCGFRCLGAVEDPEDGTVWRWELPRPE